MHHAEAHGLHKVAGALSGLAEAGLADPPCDPLLRAASRGSFL